MSNTQITFNQFIYKIIECFISIRQNLCNKKLFCQTIHLNSSLLHTIFILWPWEPHVLPGKYYRQQFEMTTTICHLHKNLYLLFLYRISVFSLWSLCFISTSILPSYIWQAFHLCHYDSYDLALLAALL